VAVEREQRDEETHDERAEEEPDRAKKGEAAQNREQDEERVELHPPPDEFGAEQVVDEPHGKHAPESKTDGGRNRAYDKEVENGGDKDERRADGRH